MNMTRFLLNHHFDLTKAEGVAPDMVLQGLSNLALWKPVSYIKEFHNGEEIHYIGIHKKVDVLGITRAGLVIYNANRKITIYTQEMNKPENLQMLVAINGGSNYNTAHNVIAGMYAAIHKDIFLAQST